MLRLAEIADIPHLLRMSKFFHEASPYRDQPFDDDRTIDVLTEIVTADRNEKIALLLEVNNPEGTVKTVGMLLAMKGQSTFNREWFAAEIAWWVDPEHRGKAADDMRYAYEWWASRVGCTRATLVSLDERVGKYYRRRKYVEAERTYIKELN